MNIDLPPADIQHSARIEWSRMCERTIHIALCDDNSNERVFVDVVSPVEFPVFVTPYMLSDWDGMTYDELLQQIYFDVDGRLSFDITINTDMESPHAAWKDALVSLKRTRGKFSPGKTCDKQRMVWTSDDDGVSWEWDEEEMQW